LDGLNAGVIQNHSNYHGYNLIGEFLTEINLVLFLAQRKGVSQTWLQILYNFKYRNYFHTVKVNTPGKCLKILKYTGSNTIPGNLIQVFEKYTEQKH
jgi:hypothetical protein